MPNLTVRLSAELSKKLNNAATNNAKTAAELAIDILENALSDRSDSHGFIGAWKDSDINPNDIISARTVGRNIEFGD